MARSRKGRRCPLEGSETANAGDAWIAPSEGVSDLEEIRELAWAPRGYRDHGVRMRVWPKLLGLDTEALEEPRACMTQPHESTDQIDRDVQRSFTQYMRSSRWNAKELEALREEMFVVINAIVRKYDGILHYFQGFHDVIGVFLLVAAAAADDAAANKADVAAAAYTAALAPARRRASGSGGAVTTGAAAAAAASVPAGVAPDVSPSPFWGVLAANGASPASTESSQGSGSSSGKVSPGRTAEGRLTSPDRMVEATVFALAEQSSVYFMRDCMRDSFRPVSKVLELLPVLLGRFAPEAQAFIAGAEVGPFYALPWYITWFSHDVPRLSDAARIFDALLASHPLMVLYVCAALVAHHADELLRCESEFASVHGFLASLPQDRDRHAAAAGMAVDDHFCDAAADNGRERGSGRSGSGGGSGDGGGRRSGGKAGQDAAATGEQDTQAAMWEAVLAEAHAMFQEMPPEQLLGRAKRPLRNELAEHSLKVLSHPPFWEMGIGTAEWVLAERGKLANDIARVGRGKVRRAIAAGLVAIGDATGVSSRATSAQWRRAAAVVATTADGKTAWWQSGFGGGGFGGSGFGGGGGGVISGGVRAWVLTSVAGISVVAVTVVLVRAALTADDARFVVWMRQMLDSTTLRSIATMSGGNAA
ncbi:unnamed protein product [Phaeothamnion confervicola]